MALGLLVVVPSLLWAGVARPWWDGLQELREVVVAERELLERERTLLQEAPTLPTRSAAARAALARKESLLVQSRNMALAEATVTQAIQDRARQSRALLLEARSVPRDPLAPAPAGLIPIRLNIRVESDFEGILDFVYALEADPLLLRVFAFSIEPDGDGAMTLAATVEAYALGMPPPPATGAMSDGHAPAGDVPGNGIREQREG